mgnify:CR=1 FL=1
MKHMYDSKDAKKQFLQELMKRLRKRMREKRGYSKMPEESEKKGSE